MNSRAIKDRLAEMDMSQNELARRVGASYGHISNIVTGKRDPKTSLFRKICEELDQDPKELW